MSSTVRFHLKAATAHAHDRVDALFSRFDLTDPSDYGRFLQAQAGAFLAIEPALDAAGAADVLSDWSQRRRSHLIRSDLAALGLSPLPAVSPPDLASEAAILGAIYVLEGSRMGGAMLESRVSDTLPKAFLARGNPLLWRTFVAVLDKRLSSGRAQAGAAHAASAVFDIFEKSARQTLGADRP